MRNASAKLIYDSIWVLHPVNSFFYMFLHVLCRVFPRRADSLEFQRGEREIFAGRGGGVVFHSISRWIFRPPPKTSQTKRDTPPKLHKRNRNRPFPAEPCENPGISTIPLATGNQAGRFGLHNLRGVEKQGKNKNVEISTSSLIRSVGGVSTETGRFREIM